jgi:hypothetical protein
MSKHDGAEFWNYENYTFSTTQLFINENGGAYVVAANLAFSHNSLMKLKKVWKRQYFGVAHNWLLFVFFLPFILTMIVELGQLSEHAIPRPEFVQDDYKIGVVAQATSTFD